MSGRDVGSDARGHEYARNDEALGADVEQALRRQARIEVRTVDTRANINGRIREYSRTTVRETYRNGRSLRFAPR